MSNATVEAMDTIVSGLENEYLYALANVGSTSDWFSGSTKAAVLKAVQDTGKLIDRLGSELRDQVINGQMTFAKWSDLAKTYHDSLEYYVSDIGSWSFTGVVSGALSQTAKDVATKVEALPGDSMPYLVLVVVGLVAFAVIRVVR